MRVTHRVYLSSRRTRGTNSTARHFSSTFLQLVNCSKSSIMNWVIKLNLSIRFCFEKPLEDFPFYSPIVFPLWFRYSQTCIKESCMYLPSQLFFKTLHRTLKSQENSKKKKKKKSIFQRSAHLNFKNISFGGTTTLSLWTKQTVEKLNLSGKTAVDKTLDKSLSGLDKTLTTFDV